MIKIGDSLPDATLTESTEFGEACPVAPAKVSAARAAAGKRIVIFGLPGAFTPTCSAKHVPGYVAQLDALKQKGVDEVWCLSVNDGYVMAAWGRDQKAIGKIRFLGDGSADLTKKLGLDTETPGCAIGPTHVPVSDLAKGKRIVIFGLPGAFTPTCSAKHVPSYLGNVDKLKAKKVDEIWCVSVNDAFVMGAWAREQKSQGKVRMMADGSATFTKALGLELDLVARGMGVRSQRYSMLVDNGVVKKLNLEEGGALEISGADTILGQI